MINVHEFIRSVSVRSWLPSRIDCRNSDRLVGMMAQRGPQMSTYFEDLEIGQTFHSTHDCLMSREAIIAYAKEWDPQLYHIDEDAAAQSPVGKIFASAFHSMAVAQKLAHEAGAFEVLPVIGLGINNLEFPKPVIEGDRVSVRVVVKDKRPSRSRPEQGLVTLHIELLNQDGDVVLHYMLTEIVRRKPRS